MQQATLHANFSSRATQSKVVAFGFAAALILAAAAMFQPLIALIAGAAVLAAGIFLARIQWLLYLVIFLIPFSVYAEIGGMPVSSDLLKVPLLLGLCFLFVGSRKKFQIATPVTYPLLGFGFLAGASIFRIVDPGAAREILRLLSNIGLFFCALNLITRRDQLQAFFNILLISTALASAYGLYQFFVLKDLGAIWFWLHPNLIHMVNASWRDRAVSTFTTDNEFAAYLNSALACIAMYFLYPTTKQRNSVRLFAWAVLVISVLAEVLTFSRGGWVAFLISAIAVTLMLLRSRGQRLFVLALAVAILVGIIGGIYLFGLAGLVADRMELDSFTTTTRGLVAQAALSVFAEHPLVGIGYANFPFLYHSYLALPQYFDADAAVGPHNIYLFVASQMGILGLIFQLWMLGSTCYRGFRNFPRHPPSVAAAVQLGVAASFLTILVHGCIDDVPLFGSHTQPLAFFLMGLFYAAGRLQPDAAPLAPNPIATVRSLTSR